MASSDTLARWGVEDLPPPPPENDGKTRSVDTKSFANKWLADDGAEEAPKYDTDSWKSTLNAASRSLLEGVPVIGPYVRSAADAGSAAVRSAVTGEPYKSSLKFVKENARQSIEAHPVASTVGDLTGALAPYVALGPIPAVSNALGMTGTLAARTGLGAASNALIGGADAAVRSGVDPTQTALGTGIGLGIGALAPGIGHVAGNAMNWLTRPAHDAVTQRLLGVAAANDIPIGAVQTSTSPFVRKLGQIAGQFPGSGQNAFYGEQVQRFTRAISHSFGEDTESLTPQVMQNARQRLGREFDHVAQNTTIHVDHAFAHDMTTIAREAQSVLPQQEVAPLANQMRNISQLIDDNGRISGEAYQNLTKKGAPLDRAIHSDDPNVSHYAGQIRESLDDAMQRSATPENAARLREARRQYRNMMTVAPLVVKGIPGEVTPLSLQGQVNKKFTNRAFHGGGELGDLGDLGQAFFRQPRDSGTPIGNLVVDQLMRHGNALGAAALAAATGGGYLAGYDPSDILKGVGGLASAGVLARGTTAVLNRPQALNALISRAPYLAAQGAPGAALVNRLAQPDQ